MSQAVELIMAVWQFAVIAALIGALLIYVGILTSRVGRTNATLKRIEAALLARDPLKGEAPVTTAQADATGQAEEPVAEAPGAVAQAAEAVVQAPEAVVQAPEAARPRDVAVTDTGSYLTLRDLKVFARAAATEEGAVMKPAGPYKPGSRYAPDTDPLDTTGELPMLVIDEPPTSEGAEPPMSATISPVNADLVLTSPESVLTSSENASDSAVQHTTDEQQSPPRSDAVTDDDLAEKKNQDALLILNNQRRRRRARGL
jgi:hypothetical protein